MSEINKIQLKESCVLNAPFQTYDKDFSFIVNGEEFRTSRFVSDLLSPTICRIHLNDPTFDKYIINTKTRGNFSNILNLINFKQQDFSNDELEFIIEVIESLGNENYTIDMKHNDTELNNSNVLQLIQKHEKHSNFFKGQLEKETNFASENFFELCETKEEELSQLNITTLKIILSNKNLQLNDEDQLLEFVNRLYISDHKYSELYEYVSFLNASGSSITQFVENYNMDDITKSVWYEISCRLIKEIKNETNEQEMSELTTKNLHKYQNKNKNQNNNKKQRGEKIEKNEGKNFDGIINRIRTKSGSDIFNVIDVTSSSIWNNCSPRNAVLYDTNLYFESNGIKDDWICFDFKEHRIIPTDYTIKSADRGSPNRDHYPKSWVIETSNDQTKWTVIDEVKNDSHLNGPKYIHTFKIQHQTNEEVRYIRMRQTDKDWDNCYYLMFDSFELYGTLI